MSKLHLGNLIEIRHWIVDDGDENDEGRWETQMRYQNANTEQDITFEGKRYPFLSFIYQGATRTRTGDNIEAALALATNQLSMDLCYDIVVIGYDDSQPQHHVKRQVVVNTCLLNNEFTQVDKVLNTEYWIGGSMNYDELTVEVTLSSAIDAVYAGLPNFYLTESMVGRLPTTARVRTS